MRVAVTSDLHVDHHPQVPALLAEVIRRMEADVLVVAGDLTADAEVLEQTLSVLRPAAREAVFIPGNHDLWCRAGEASSRERYERILPARARSAGFHAPFADEVPPTLFGHRFVGVTGWYDYSLRTHAHDGELTRRHYEAGHYGLLRWNDKRAVRWPDDHGELLDDPAICDGQVHALRAQLAAIGDEAAVVVTHHLAFRSLVTEKGIAQWDFLNGFMGAERLGEAIRAAPGVKLAIAGHTHFQKDATILTDGRTLCALTSPLGYPREYRRAGQTLEQRVAERVTLVAL